MASPFGLPQAGDRVGHVHRVIGILEIFNKDDVLSTFCAAYNSEGQDTHLRSRPDTSALFSLMSSLSRAPTQPSHVSTMWALLIKIRQIKGL